MQLENRINAACAGYAHNVRGRTHTLANKCFERWRRRSTAQARRLKYSCAPLFAQEGLSSGATSLLARLAVAERARAFVASPPLVALRRSETVRGARASGP